MFVLLVALAGLAIYFVVSLTHAEQEPRRFQVPFDYYVSASLDEAIAVDDQARRHREDSPAARN